jgi:hypothetical protein
MSISQNNPKLNSGFSKPYTILENTILFPAIKCVSFIKNKSKFLLLYHPPAFTFNKKINMLHNNLNIDSSMDHMKLIQHNYISINRQTINHSIKSNVLNILK